MPGFAQQLEKAARDKRRLRCDQLLEQMEPDDAAAFREALHDPATYSAETIVEAAAVCGFKLSPNPVRLWRARNGIR